MRPMLKWMGACGTALLILAPGALGQGQGPGPGGGRGPGGPGRGGMGDREEMRERMRERMQERMQDRRDEFGDLDLRDADGRPVDRDRLERFLRNHPRLAELKARIDALRAKLDTDGDGRISLEERQAQPGLAAALHRLREEFVRILRTLREHRENDPGFGPGPGNGPGFGPGPGPGNGPGVGPGPGNDEGEGPGGWWTRWRRRWFDRREDVRDHREDVRDRREDVGDRREDGRDRREDRRDGRNGPRQGQGGGRR